MHHRRRWRHQTIIVIVIAYHFSIDGIRNFLTLQNGWCVFWGRQCALLIVVVRRPKQTVQRRQVALASPHHDFRLATLRRVAATRPICRGCWTGHHLGGCWTILHLFRGRFDDVIITSVILSVESVKPVFQKTVPLDYYSENRFHTLCPSRRHWNFDARLPWRHHGSLHRPASCRAHRGHWRR